MATQGSHSDIPITLPDRAGWALIDTRHVELTATELRILKFMEKKVGQPCSISDLEVILQSGQSPEQYPAATGRVMSGLRYKLRQAEVERVRLEGRDSGYILLVMVSDKTYQQTRAWVARKLEPIYAPTEAEIWIDSPHQLLGGKSPAELIRWSETDRVLDIIEQLVTGAYI